jgi:hypothetical protein
MHCEEHEYGAIEEIDLFQDWGQLMAFVKTVTNSGIPCKARHDY